MTIWQGNKQRFRKHTTLTHHLQGRSVPSKIKVGDLKKKEIFHRFAIPKGTPRWV